MSESSKKKYKFKQQEFEQIFLENYPDLRRFGNFLSPDNLLIEDCIQDLFIHFYEKNIDLSSIQNLKAYLFTSLRRRILEKKKKNKPLLPYPASVNTQLSEEVLFIKKEEIEAKNHLLISSLNLLPERQKEAIYLKFFNHLSAKEIAEIMNISPQVVTNMVYKAVKKLKAMTSKTATLLSPISLLINFF